MTKADIHIQLICNQLPLTVGGRLNASIQPADKGFRLQGQQDVATPR